MKYFILGILSLLLITNEINGQDSTKSGLYLGSSYALQAPSGELADRFGANSNFGLQLDYLIKESWVIRVSTSFMFGSNVKENTFDNLLTQDGSIINGNQDIVTLSIRERGQQSFIEIGRIHDLTRSLDLSGFHWSLGFGYISHRIRIRANEGEVRQFQEPYERGYDRLTGGFALKQFIGYQHMDYRGLLNFFIGFEAIEGFTKDLRGYNYNTNTIPDGNRLDVLLGGRVGFLITLRSFKDPEEFYY